MASQVLLKQLRYVLFSRIGIYKPDGLQNLQLIQMMATASHQALLQSTNLHYLRLYEENMMLKERMSNEKYAYIFNLLHILTLLYQFSQVKDRRIRGQACLWTDLPFSQIW